MLLGMLAFGLLQPRRVEPTAPSEDSSAWVRRLMPLINSASPVAHVTQRRCLPRRKLRPLNGIGFWIWILHVVTQRNSFRCKDLRQKEKLAAIRVLKQERRFIMQTQLSGKPGRSGKRYRWISLRVSQDMKRRIKRTAKRQKRSVSAAVNGVITEFVAKRRRKSISLPLQLHLLGQLHAKQQGISFSAYVESLLAADDAKLNGTKRAA